MCVERYGEFDKSKRKNMPTIKQKKAFGLIAKNKGNVGKSMREAGYAAATAKNPKVLTGSKGWVELRKEYLPLESLAKLHQQQLKAEKIQVVNKIAGTYPDNDVRLRALDLGYKVHGSYAPDRIEITKRKFEHLSNAELAALIKKTKDFLTKQ